MMLGKYFMVIFCTVMERVIFIILLMLPVLCFSSEEQSIKFDDWMTHPVSEDISAVYTTSSSGYVFSYACVLSHRKCLFSYTSDLNCKSDKKIPVLVNTEAGVFAVDATCKSGLKRSVFLEDDLFSEVVSRGNNIGKLGIAMPLENSQFRVLEFSLKGSKQAMTYAESILSGPVME